MQFVRLFALASLVWLWAGGWVLAQKVTVTGIVMDSDGREPMLLTQVWFVAAQDSQVVVTDLEGRFSVDLPAGDYVLKINQVGYSRVNRPLKLGVGQAPLQIDIQMKTLELEVVEIVADRAESRATPVVFSTVDTRQIEEELAGRDIPLVLNATPGVYATQGGGGFGDSRINLRGFDQRYIVVMIDGVPVNDMQNGRLFWSNWAGLADVTRNIEVQRGLGASKLAIASVGGTMNIITRGIEGNMGASILGEVGNNNYWKTGFGYNSGLLPGNFSLTVGASYTTGDGWVDMAWFKSLAYYIKLQKLAGNHLLTLSAFGADQQHGQRPFRDTLFSRLNGNFARSLNLNPLEGDPRTARGLRYNPFWGPVPDDYQTSLVYKGRINTSVNMYHKPVINFTHFWTINERSSLSNVLYGSIGRGGGTSLDNETIPRDANGQWDLAPIIAGNRQRINPLYSDTETESNRFIRISRNDHWWVGLLSTYQVKLSERWKLMGGLDARSYTGSRYRKVYDLLGGDYRIGLRRAAIDPRGPEYLQNQVFRVGDKFDYDDRAFVHWGGLFSQAEWSNQKWSAFFTAALSAQGYQRLDYFLKKDLVLPDTLWRNAVGFGDTIERNGVIYTMNSPEARTAQTDLEWFWNHTLKLGGSYRFNERHVVFVNAGWLGIAPRFQNVFDNRNNRFRNINTQQIYMAELGYGLNTKQIRLQANVYHTQWNNKPPDRSPSLLIGGERFSFNIAGITTIHQGAELDGFFKLMKGMELQTAIGLGNWYYASTETAFLEDDAGNILDTIAFNVTGVSVGDAAQTQFSAGLRLEPLRLLNVGDAKYQNWYFTLRGLFFGRHYSNFDPLDFRTTIVTDSRNTWRSPDYFLLELHTGYTIPLAWKLKLQVSGSVTNLLNTIYVSDADNGSSFDARTAQVFMGLGRQWQARVKLFF